MPETVALPALPHGWEYQELDKLLMPKGISYGIVQPGSDDRSGIPIIRVKDIRRRQVFTGEVMRVSPDIESAYSRTRLEGGEVLLSLVGSVGEVAIAPAEVVGWNVARAVAVLKIAGGVSSQWIMHCLTTDLVRQHMGMWQNTTVQATLNLRDVRRLPIVLPPKAERDAILAVLGALDDKIVANERIAATADELVQALFDAAVGAEHVVLKLPAAIGLTFGAPFTSSQFNSESVGLPLMRIRDLKTFEPQNWTTQRLPKDRLVQPGETVAGMDAEFRPTFWLGKPALLNQRVLLAASLVGGGSALAREILRRPLAHVESYKTGTTVAHLNKNDLDGLDVTVPGAAQVLEFGAKAEPLRQQIVAAAAEKRTLTSLRDTLLPKLMSGQLTVKQAETLAEDVI